MSLMHVHYSWLLVYSFKDLKMLTYATLSLFDLKFLPVRWTSSKCLLLGLWGPTRAEVHIASVNKGVCVRACVCVRVLVCVCGFDFSRIY